MSEPSLETRESVDVLMREYALLKAEVGTHIGFYKSHVSKLQLMGSATLAGAAYVIANPGLLPGPLTWWWWSIALLIPVMTGYLLFDIIESQYAIVLLGERMITIEEDVNGIIGRRLLMWESHGSPRFWQRFHAVRGVINPDWFLSTLGMVVSASIGVGPAMVLFWQLRRSSGDSVVRPLLAWVIPLVAIGIMTLVIVVGKRVLLGLRGHPHAYMRRVLATPLDEPVGD